MEGKAWVYFDKVKSEKEVIGSSPVYKKSHGRNSYSLD